MKKLKINTLALTVAMVFHGVAPSLHADVAANIGNFEIKGELPLTGNPTIDRAFKRRFIRAIEQQGNTKPLPPHLRKRFDDLDAGLGLDQHDLELAAKGVASSQSTGSMPSTANNVITPDNVKSMPLGASLWTDQSMFARRSVFDSGILSSESLIPNLQGITEAGLTSAVSSRTDKTTESSKFSMEFGASARYGGFQGSLGYKHDEATEKTTMKGRATASVYNYATNTLRIEPEQAGLYRELRGALRGVALADTELDNYVRITKLRVKPGDPEDVSTYQRVAVLKTFDGIQPPSAYSPRAHIQALMRLEDIFSQLWNQYYQYDTYKKIQQETLLDMQSLKVAINSSIKAFYTNYGDAFVTEVSGYSEIEGQAELSQESGADNAEKNNAGTLSGGYNSFIGGAEASTSIGKWARSASASGASQITTTVIQRPNNGADLSSYDKSLRDWVQNAINSTGASAALPAVQSTLSFPNPPKPRPWQDDPFAPPAKAKDFEDWTKSRDAFKDSKGYKVPSWLTKKEAKGEMPANNNPDAARDAVAEFMIGEDNGNRGSVRPQPDGQRSVSEEVVLDIVVDDEQRNSSAKLSGQPKHQPVAGEVSSSSNSGHSIHGESLYKKITYELKALKAYGKKIHARDRRLSKQSRTWLATPNRLDGLSDTAEGNEMFLDKMMVSSFKALPFTAVLVALRPDLELPVPIGSLVDGFINTSALLITLNRYTTLDTYLNFISSIPESGLGSTSIPSDFHKFVKHFEAVVMPLVQASMTSGQDLGDDQLAAVLNNEIVGLSEDGKIRYPNKTKLHEYLKHSDDAYAYLYTLAEDPAYYSVIGKAPGGYLPFAPHKDGGYCLPKLKDVRELPNFESWADGQVLTEKPGYRPAYLYASDCVKIRPDTSMAQLLGGAPQTPMFPLYIYAEKIAPLLNFVQFVGGSRLIIGRDISLAPPVGDISQLPKSAIASASDAAKLAIGYKPSLVGDASRLNLLNTSWQDDRFKNPETLNAFLPSDISWQFSLWFPGNDRASISGYDRNQVLAARIGFYPETMQNRYTGSRFFGRGGSCIPDSYCPKPTFHFMAPYSYQITPDDPRNDYGLIVTPSVPADNFLIGPSGQIDQQGQAVIGKVSLRDYGNSPSTLYTSGMILLYPITIDILSDAKASGAFAYSSGSKPKDIYSKDDKGDSPFNTGFTKALLQR